MLFYNNTVSYTHLSAQSAFLSQAVAQESLAWQQESASSTTAAASTAVSYTHLDVYKRQDILLLLIQRYYIQKPKSSF